MNFAKNNIKLQYSPPPFNLGMILFTLVNMNTMNPFNESLPLTNYHMSPTIMLNSNNNINNQNFLRRSSGNVPSNIIGKFNPITNRRIPNLNQINCVNTGNNITNNPLYNNNNNISTYSNQNVFINNDSRITKNKTTNFIKNNNLITNKKDQIN